MTALCTTSWAELQKTTVLYVSLIQCMVWHLANTILTVKNGDGSIRLGGGLLVAGMRRLVRINQTINA